MPTPAPILSLPSFGKINLCLRVLDRRDDGYHEVRTLLQTIDLCDDITFQSTEQLRIQLDDPLDLPVEENLVYQAATLLQSEARIRRGAHIRLHKRLPVAAGLGGGSSNAAVTLLGLNQVWNIRWPLHRLLALAKRIGCDVPFFLTGGTVLALGRGDEIYPQADLPECFFVLVCPPVKISTKIAYGRLKLRLTKRCNEYNIQRFCDELSSGRVPTAWVFNDLEESVFRNFPEVAEARSALQEAGCAVAAMSGSGAATFGLVWTFADAQHLQQRLTHLAWPTYLVAPLSRASYNDRLFQRGLQAITSLEE